MKKIIFFADRLSSGGAERVTSVLANGLAEKGYKVTLVLMNRDTVAYKINPQVKLIELEEQIGKRDSLYYLKKYRAVSKNLVNMDAVISLAMPQTNLYIAFAAKLHHKKLVLSERNDPASYPSERILRWGRNFTYYLADRLVFQTNDAKKYFKDCLQKKGSIIPNPISEGLPERYFGVREKRVVNFCRLEPQKNLKLLLSSFEKFSKMFPDYRLEIYGSGVQENELRDLIKEKGFSERVSLKPNDSAVHEKVRNAAMFVSSSDYEGISNSMIEAMAIGLPVVCTNCPSGGARMMIDNGINGILVPVGDEAALYNAMRMITEDPKLAEKLSLNAVNIRERLAGKKIVDLWEEVIKNADKKNKKTLHDEEFKIR